MTVEPTDGCVPDSIIPAAGSYWAEVVELPSQSSAVEPEARVYSVRRHGASEDEPLMQIERRFLRHRSLHTKAFVHVSNDKQHDSHAAQMFLEKTFSWMGEWCHRTSYLLLTTYLLLSCIRFSLPLMASCLLV